MRNLLNQHIKNSDVTTMRTAGKETSIQNIITIFNFLVFLFSPLTCFYLCLFVMTVFSSFLNSTNRKILGLLVVVSGSVSIASRQVGAFQFDDMLRYYETFSKIFNGDFGAIFSYGGGLEVLPMLYYLLIAKLLGNIQVSSLVFWESLLTSLIFWFWLEKYGMEDVGKKNRSLCIASTLLFFSFIIKLSARLIALKK